MRKLLTLLIVLSAISLAANTNVLQLIWMQPPGYESTLYSATNLGGAWTSLGVVNPPFNVSPTNQVSYFYVSVAPTNDPGNYVGNTDPTNVDAMAGSYFVNTNDGDWWVNVYGGTNGWVWYISGQ